MSNWKTVKIFADVYRIVKEQCNGQIERYFAFKITQVRLILDTACT
jgi:hypothetical protein